MYSKEKLTQIFIDVLEKNNIFLSDVALFKNNILNDISRERCEFIGDSIINFIVTVTISKVFADKNEGRLSKVRAALISKHSLNWIFEKYFLTTIKEKIEINSNSKFYADMFESLLGALFLDCGSIMKVMFFTDNMFKDNIMFLLFDHKNIDFKSILQSYTQQLDRKTPVYKLIGNNNNIFSIYLTWNKYHSYGSGCNVMSAEQNAAKILCKKLKINIKSQILD